MRRVSGDAVYFYIQRRDIFDSSPVFSHTHEFTTLLVRYTVVAGIRTYCHRSAERMFETISGLRKLNAEYTHINTTARGAGLMSEWTARSSLLFVAGGARAGEGTKDERVSPLDGGARFLKWLFFHKNKIITWVRIEGRAGHAKRLPASL